MGIILTQLPTGKIEATGGELSFNFTIDDHLSPKRTKNGVSLINDDSKGIHSFEPVSVDPTNGVEKVIEFSGIEHIITDQASLYEAVKLIFRSAGGTALKTLLLAISTANSQEPVFLDTPVQIEFGVAQKTGDDPVMIDALGNITINKVGIYEIEIDAHFGRIGSSGGISELRFRGLTDGVPNGITLGTKLNDPNSISAISIATKASLINGNVLTFEMYRDSLGVNEGGLFKLPSTVVGWNDGFCVVLIIRQRI